jgi:YVTN family beta-propeller protein
VTGSYVTIPVTCRVLQIPLVWVVQSTWLPDFFCLGAGMTDHIRPTPIKALLDWFILRFINFWIRNGFLNPVNRTAKHFGVAGYESIFEFWRGDITLVAEPPEFTGIKLPFNHYFIGPLIPYEEFPMPQGFTDVPKDKPLIYFAMGSSGTPRIVANGNEGAVDGTVSVIDTATNIVVATIPVGLLPVAVAITGRRRDCHELCEPDGIFGDNPDNQGPNSLINATESYRNYLEGWDTIQNKA